MEQNRNSSSTNSFLLGLIVGVLLTLLLVTKKGRMILKTLTDEGMGKIEDLEKIIKERMTDQEDEEEFEEDMEPVVPETNGKALETSTNIAHLPKSSPRRFFRGTSKKN